MRTKVLLLRQKIEPLDVVLLIVLGICALVIILPFYNAVISSFVSSIEYSRKALLLWPDEWILDNYTTIFKYTSLLTGYKNTLIIVLIGVPIRLLLTVVMGYCFSQNFLGKSILFKIVLFTMFFSGGTVPSYILTKQLGLMNTYWATILSGAISTYYMIIIKGSFESIPEALKEAAIIDGANDMQILFRIMLPLQLPMLATFTLFFTVGLWNSWFWPMLTMPSVGKQVLPVMLRQVSNQAQALANEAAAGYGDENVALSFGIGVKMAATVMTMLPVMLFYPFLQKYFVKGVMVGSIKM